jgi:hypothetical protein
VYHCPLKNKNSKKQRQKQKQTQNKTKQIKTKQNNNNNKNTKKYIGLLSILNRLFITTNAQQDKKNYLSKTLYTHKI